MAKDYWEPLLRERIAKAALLGALASAEHAIQGVELILASPTCQKGIKSVEVESLRRLLSNLRQQLRQSVEKLS